MSASWSQSERDGKGDTFSGRIRHHAESSPGREFLVDIRRPFAIGRSTPTLTYQQFEQRAARLATILADFGARPGCAVHVQLPNSPEYLLALAAVAKLGAVWIPSSPHATPDDVAYITSHAGCRLSIVDSANYAGTVVASELNPELETIFTVGSQVGDSIDMLNGLESVDEFTEDRSTADGLAAVLYTSGTTGWPKGVMITHANLTFVGDAVSGYLGLSPADRWLVSLPLSHMNALGYSTMSAVASGGSVALVDGFDPAEWVTAAQRSAATVASLFSVHARKLVRTCTAPVSTSLRRLMFAQHLAHEERARLQELVGARLLQVYGMTETIAPTIADPTDCLPRSETMGRLADWATASVVDRHGVTVADGTPGELVVGGEPGRSLMAGYWQRDDETNRVMDGGWLHTGDRVVRDAEGYFTFLGRASEVIKPGADNVSAPEIERVLLEHVAVQDSAVVGARAPDGDEMIVAFVVLHAEHDATPDEIITWSSTRLARYKVPHVVSISRCLPRNPVGKIKKRALQELADALLIDLAVRQPADAVGSLPDPAR